MTPREFFDKVSLMRRLQRDYFRSKSKSALERSKAVEREVDAEIERVNRIIGIPNNHPPSQGSLFG